MRRGVVGSGRQLLQTCGRTHSRGLAHCVRASDFSIVAPEIYKQGLNIESPIYGGRILTQSALQNRRLFKESNRKVKARIRIIHIPGVGEKNVRVSIAPWHVLQSHEPTSIECTGRRCRATRHQSQFGLLTQSSERCEERNACQPTTSI